MYQQNKSRYEELMREGKRMEEAAKAAAANERKRSDSEVFNEMINKMSSSSDQQNHSIKSETKMVYRTYAYVYSCTHGSASACSYFLIIIHL